METFITGDSLEVLSGFSDRSVDFAITSPPYNIGKAYETSVPLEEYLTTHKKVLSELDRVLSPSGALCWQVGTYVDNGEVFPLDMYYYPIFKEMGYRLRNRIIWRFGHGAHCRNRLSGRYETILWFTKGDTYTFNLDHVRIPSKYSGKKYYKGPNKGKLSGNPLGKNPSDVWDIMESDWDSAIWDIPNVKHNHPEKTAHPCQFPMELAERCVLAFSNVGDTVVDPYCGVGTSILAAIKNGRRGVGIDRDSSYIGIAWGRLEQLRRGILPERNPGPPKLYN